MRIYQGRDVFSSPLKPSEGSSENQFGNLRGDPWGLGDNGPSTQSLPGKVYKCKVMSSSWGTQSQGYTEKFYMSGVEGQGCLILWANGGGFSGIGHLWTLCPRSLLGRWNDPAEDGPEEARMEGSSEGSFKQLPWVFITNVRTAGERSLVTRRPSKNPPNFTHERKTISIGICYMQGASGPDNRLARKMFLPSYHCSL